MLKNVLLAASTAALIATCFIGVSVATSGSAEARGFGCRLNASRCDNQLNTPRTFASDRKKNKNHGPGRKKGKKRQ